MQNNKIIREINLVMQIGMVLENISVVMYPNPTTGDSIHATAQTHSAAALWFIMTLNSCLIAKKL